MCRNAVGSDHSPLANGIDTGVFVLLGALLLIAATFAFMLVKSSRSPSTKQRHASACRTNGWTRWEE